LLKKLTKKASAGPFVHSLSNLEDNRRITGIENLETKISFHPNPMNSHAKIYWHNPAMEGYSLIVYDLTGHILKRIDHIYDQEYTLERGDFKEGYYIIELQGSNVVMRGRLGVR
jgi:hypothetical protein